MRTFVDPPLSQWQPATRSDSGGARSAHADRAMLIDRINARAVRLGTGRIEQAQPIIATGHQAWLWHPGILAKDIAMAVACERLHASPLHLVVDQDAHEALHLELPVLRGERLHVVRKVLAPHAVTVPTGAQPAADVAQLRRSLESFEDARVQPIIDALHDLPACRTLAEQIAVITARLMRPMTGEVALLMVSDLPGLSGYDALIERMLGDARRCVRAYNAAVTAVPEAGVLPLTAERERVELPLWAVRWGQPRQRVYADLADSTPWLVDEAGEPIDRAAVQLLPRALLLSGVMRSLGCELFIHGRGGAHYDRATEQWWSHWQAAPLAPRAVVSADLHLDFDAPLADAQAYRRAVWLHRYALHNVDRLLKLDGPLVKQKRCLIEHMDDDRDRHRRWLAFREIQRINAQLVRSHPQLIERTHEQLRAARAGLANARIAQRRDWCFAIYPADQLQALRTAIEQQSASEVAR